MGKPELSVIIASYNAEKTIEACLLSLTRQAGSDLFEIILVDSSTDKTPAIVNRGFPHVRLYHFGQRKFCGDARNIGIAKARGEIVAFLDADCRAATNWVHEILGAHQSDSPAVGGVIDTANPAAYVGWAAYFCEFSRWMPGTQDRWMDDIAAANISYKKEVFSIHGGFIEGTYCSDTDFNWRIAESGQRLRFDPRIAVYHHNIDNPALFLKHEFFHGRSFGRVRCRSKGFSSLKRLYYTLFSPLIPFRLMAKIGKNVMKSRVYLAHFLKSLPLLIPGVVSWSIGEAIGYIEGRSFKRQSGGGAQGCESKNR